MAEHGLHLALELRDDALGQHFAQLDPPLIERVDVPDRALGKHAVLVKRDELAEHFRRQPLGEDGVRGAIAPEHPMGNEVVRGAFGLYLLARLAERQRLGLRENVRQQHVVVPAERVQRLGEGDEVTGDETGPLMDQLVEGMLSVGARLSPVDGPGGVVDLGALPRDVLAVALHRQLLQVRGKALQVLLVGQDGHRLGAEEIRVPDREQAEVLVHLVEAVQKSAEALGTDGDHRREADRRVHRIAAAHPVPESEHVRGVDAELRYLRRVG